MFTVHLAKEPFKFSCSHFTILAPDRAERLHGHNYQVRVDIEVSDVDPKLGLAFDFNEVKPLIRALCDQLDERILIPLQSPYLKVTPSDRQIDVDFLDRHYSFPIGDVLSLPLANITSEELARWASEQLVGQMKNLPYWTALQVNVEETRGQSVSYSTTR
ncbi:MAG: 6-carboxytetrahydropterin synthase [Bdellovibrionales bacterium]|nr:6-carboxytetrahydropterin synthase [Bdellovibrionales bacterium]